MANTIVRIAVPLSIMHRPHVVLSEQHMNEGGNLEQPRNRSLEPTKLHAKPVIDPTFLSLFHLVC